MNEFILGNLSQTLVFFKEKKKKEKTELKSPWHYLKNTQMSYVDEPMLRSLYILMMTVGSAAVVISFIVCAIKIAAYKKGQIRQEAKDAIVFKAVIAAILGGAVSIIGFINSLAIGLI